MIASNSIAFHVDIIVIIIKLNTIVWYYWIYWYYFCITHFEVQLRDINFVLWSNVVKLCCAIDSIIFCMLFPPVLFGSWCNNYSIICIIHVFKQYDLLIFLHRTGMWRKDHWNYYENKYDLDKRLYCFFRGIGRLTVALAAIRPLPTPHPSLPTPPHSPSLTPQSPKREAAGPIHAWLEWDQTENKITPNLTSVRSLGPIRRVVWPTSRRRQTDNMFFI